MKLVTLPIYDEQMIDMLDISEPQTITEVKKPLLKDTPIVTIHFAKMFDAISQYEENGDEYTVLHYSGFTYVTPYYISKVIEQFKIFNQ